MLSCGFDIPWLFKVSMTKLWSYLWIWGIFPPFLHKKTWLIYFFSINTICHDFPWPTLYSRTHTLFHDFQAWKMKFENSLTFQVFWPLTHTNAEHDSFGSGSLSCYFFAPQEKANKFLQGNYQLSNYQLLWSHLQCYSLICTSLAIKNSLAQLYYAAT